ncbi:trafficking kinesin-binding protein 2-like [Hypanus sabinus]|uniref:trafficking kinesin-binding protein 2-like n=1 Tax=Hypanus sabinus TaxID=79690 RepID=UPI0028C39BA4|nr:trafficking kinesin-binding protein 2-like [Hypanus sabinus]
MDWCALALQVLGRELSEGVPPDRRRTGRLPAEWEPNAAGNPDKLDPPPPSQTAAAPLSRYRPSFSIGSDRLHLAENDGALPASRLGRQSRDVGTITDVCYSENVPEVEIFSLLEEGVPRYTLRADTVYGYSHDDWLHTPLLSPDLDVSLTQEQIEETLKYFREWG